MKKFLAAFLILSSFSVFAEDLLTECRLEYKTAVNSTTVSIFTNEVGEFPIEGCVNEAMKARKTSISSVAFEYSVYTKITLDETGVMDRENGVEGRSVSGVINEVGVFPTTLKYANFVR